MERNLTIDNLRGIAFGLMVFQHLFYFYDVSTDYITHYRDIEIVNIAGTISRNLFILLAGYSVYIAYNKEKEKQKKDYINKRINRSMEILEHGLLITIASYLLYPDKFIQFGILHFMAVGTLLISFVAPDKRATGLALLISILMTYPVTNTFADVITGSNAPGTMMDWFPLNKWLPVLLSGLVIGQNIDVKIPVLEFNNIITDVGKNSLNLYTIHLLILMVVYRFV